MALPFNLVKVRSDATATPSSLTVAEFSALPLNDRVRAVLEKRVQFFQNDKLIEAGEALKALRERGA
jgi:hypothetical protein